MVYERNLSNLVVNRLHDKVDLADFFLKTNLCRMKIKICRFFDQDEERANKISCSCEFFTNEKLIIFTIYNYYNFASYRKGLMENMAEFISDWLVDIYYGKYLKNCEFTRT
jgi:hypothetical protein